MMEQILVLSFGVGCAILGTVLGVTYVKHKIAKQEKEDEKQREIDFELRKNVQNPGW